MATYWPAASSNAFNTTLNGSIGSTDTTIALNSVTGLSASGGILVFDRQDGSGNNTPTLREYISFTGISGSSITGVTRGRAGSTAQSHNSGALVEENMSVDHWNDGRTLFLTEHDLAGKHVISLATVSNIWLLTSIYASGTSAVFTDTSINRYLNASGASIVGTFPIHPLWVIPGFSSAATSTAGKPVTMPLAGNWQSFWVTSRTPASACSLTVDVLKNSVSIFTSTTYPTILGAGTFGSTASIATKSFIQGDVFTIDVKSGGSIADVVVQGRAVG